MVFKFRMISIWLGSGFPLDKRIAHKTDSYLRQISLAENLFISGTTSVSQDFVAAESAEEPPPGTKASE